VPSCPDIVDQVLASDGRTYLNACLANQAGARVVKHLGPQKVAGLGAFDANTVMSFLSGPVGWAASLAMIYHGYKRTDSVLWAFAWGLTGVVGVPFALVQGFGKPKKRPSSISRIRTVARSRR
jgi:hypothetical protein